MEKGCQRARLARHALNRNNVKDVAKNPMSAQARVALLHITCTSRLLTILKSETKAIFTAASLATRAVEYLNGLQPVAELAPDAVTSDAERNAATIAPDRPQPGETSDRRIAPRQSKRMEPK